MWYETRERPTDRPHELWCRVCEHTIKKRSTDTGEVVRSDLSNALCKTCLCAGSLVWRYKLPEYVPPPVKPLAEAVEKPVARTPVPAVPAPVSGWAPLCGNPNCKGECDNISCFPPDKPTEAVIKEPTDRFWFGFYAGMVAQTLLIPVVHPLYLWLKSFFV